MDVTCMTQSSRLNQFVYLFRKNRRKLGWCVVMLDVTKWEIKRKPIADKLCIRKVLSFLFPRSVSFNPPFFFFGGGGWDSGYFWNLPLKCGGCSDGWSWSICACLSLDRCLGTVYRVSSRSFLLHITYDSRKRLYSWKTCRWSVTIVQVARTNSATIILYTVCSFAKFAPNFYTTCYAKSRSSLTDYNAVSSTHFT